MSSQKSATKRAVEDGDDAPAPKSGRGRPRKDASAPRPLPKDSNVLRSRRGRSPKNSTAPPPSLENQSVPKLGRPRKASESATPAKPPKVAGRGRGRPRKDTKEAIEDVNTKTPSTIPRANGAKKARGSSAAGKSSKGDSKSGTKLTDIVGTYTITCKSVQREWPEASEEMFIAISILKGTRSTLIESFNLGILEGVMLLAVDKDTLDSARRDMNLSKDIKATSRSSPPLQDRTVYFTWRGRDVVDTDEVHPGSNGTQTGIIKFKDNQCSSFKGIGSFPALGSECSFSGTKVDDEVDGEPEPWSNFSEEVYEEANQHRWG